MQPHVNEGLKYEVLKYEGLMNEMIRRYVNVFRYYLPNVCMHCTECSALLCMTKWLSQLRSCNKQQVSNQSAIFLRCGW